MTKSSESKRHLRIAIISSGICSTPSDCNGGIENVVHGLASELARRGHDVTLIATPGSLPIENGKLYETDKSLDDHLNKAVNYLNTHVPWDIVHEFTVDKHVIRMLNPRVMKTVFSHMYFESPNLDSSTVICDSFRLKHKKGLYSARVVYYGLYLDEYKPEFKKDDYFVFMGPVSLKCGVDIAIEAAKQASVELKVCGTEVEENFNGQLQYDNDRYYVEVLTRNERLCILAKAKGLILPLQYDAPHSIVPLEALALGTPVIATEESYVSEYIIPGISGYVGRSAYDLSQKIALINKGGINNAAVVAHAQKAYSIQRMTDTIERLYLTEVRRRKHD